jgi:hypothetical protein
MKDNTDNHADISVSIGKDEKLTQRKSTVITVTPACRQYPRISRKGGDTDSEEWLSSGRMQ